ncbi:uncharacterized protein PHACADRAFT_32351 [Phanerochaete carnosa HHB-10118-sp]|uniref:Uncharacterized protein n=1 Tax=Phanerochaete carnosa (strain HHB-10118-sp) TaxID=650164 RepID=K5VXR4_PHACS|nr:uncharacterized protein PHACADRAFT_32351 [Phanerochaete carnosa HHB-10118-sp]EKM51384.1 hypothetical protein PHACADRAFT_32351 [Phanerochaete carnosa HHB-10118-sp]
MNRFGAMLNRAYNPTSLGAGWAKFTSLLQHFVPPFIGRFRGEASLVSCLDASVHLELGCYFEYMAQLAAVDSTFWVAGGSPIFPEVRSTVKPKKRFQPDRAAKKDRQEYPENVHGRLFGDVKLSYKFMSTWRAAAVTLPTADSETSMEYKKALAQVKHYMRIVGEEPAVKRGCRYG